MGDDLSLLGGISVLQNTILGPGLLTLPWAFAQCGSGLGLTLIVLSAAASFLGMHLLSSAALTVISRDSLESRVLSLGGICDLASGRRLRWTFEIGLVLSCSGLLSSLIIIADNLQQFSWLTRWQWILSAFVFCTFPLSCLKQLSFLRYSSYASLAMTLYIAGLVVCIAITDGSKIDGAKHEIVRTDNSLGIFQAFPVFTCAFAGHMNIVPIVCQLKDASLHRMDCVILCALLISAAIYTAVAVSAYMSFGSDTPQDLLLHYSDGAWLGIARVGMSVVCIAFYPLLVQPVRATLLSWFRSEAVLAASQSSLVDGCVSPDQPTARHASNNSLRDACSVSPCGASPATSQSPRQLSGLQRKAAALPAGHPASRTPKGFGLATALIGAVCLTVALSTRSLGKVFSLCGATGFALLCNVCPAWLYLSVAVPGGSAAVRFLAKVLMCFGIMSMPICMAANMMK